MSTRILFLTIAVCGSYSGLADDIDRSANKTDQEIDAACGDNPGLQGHKAIHQHASLAKWLGSLDEIGETAPENSIPKYGLLLWKLAETQVYQVPERITAYDRTKALLLSIPGHAEYFGREIRRPADHLCRSRPPVASRWRGTSGAA